MIEQSGSSDKEGSDPIDLSQEDVRLICDLIEGETRGRTERKLPLDSLITFRPLDV